MKDAEAILDFLAPARRHPGTTRPGFSRILVEQIWQTKRLLALPGGYGYRGVPGHPVNVTAEDAVPIGDLARSDRPPRHDLRPAYRRCFLTL